MKIDKHQIIQQLKGKGDDEKAQQAETDLPGEVDTEKDSGILGKLGLNPKDLIGKFGA